MGLRLKLGLVVGVLITTVFAVYGVYTLRAERLIFMQEMRERGVALLRAFSIPSAVAMANADTPTLDNYVVEFSEASSDLNLESLVVLDFEGRVVAHTTAGHFGDLYGDPFTREALESNVPLTREVAGGETSHLLVSMPVVSGLRWGTLRAQFDLSEVNLAIATSRKYLVGFTLLLAVSSTAIAYFVLSLLVITPILRMRSMAFRFGSGQLSARVRLWQSDEVGQLGTALNGMAQQLQDYTESLEAQVEQRTEELASANAKLVRANAQLERLAKTDPLTGLHNRRHFMEQLEMEVRRGARIHHQFSVIILDVDHFKSYNDTHGHPEGDDLLQRLAALLQINLRSTDVIARYGGEEFVILLLDTGVEEGYATARKLQQAVAAQPFPHEETQPSGQLTISVGMSFYPHDSRDGRKLVRFADEALYRSRAIQ
ncbi:MAG: diguanylate cyclase, partial [Myxococcota bacterium]